jgi:hypothetical protein
MLIELGIYAKCLVWIFWRKLTFQALDKLETCRDVCTVNLRKALWTTYLIQRQCALMFKGIDAYAAYLQSITDGFKPLFPSYILPYNLYYVK